MNPRKITLKGLTTAFVFIIIGCAQQPNVTQPVQPLFACSDQWYQTIDQHVQSGDSHGHGPDVGSGEWKSVVEFKLGVRGDADVPNRDSNEWCAYINDLVFSPSFSCDNVAAGTVESRICANEPLAALDRKLEAVYENALKKATNESLSQLKAQQRGWIKGRNDCWKATDQKQCVEAEYQRRIAQLQAQYQLVESTGPVTFVCANDSANTILATFFRTQPPTLIAQYRGSESLMFLQPSASGSQYQGRNERFWEHHGQAQVTWGVDASPMQCVKK